MLNCFKKDPEMIIPESRRGRKPKACEACFKSKVSCDNEEPCERCLLRNLPCRPRNIAEKGDRSDSPSVSGPLLSQILTTQCTQQQQPYYYSRASSSSDTAGGSSLDRADMSWMKSLVNPTAASTVEHLTNDTVTRAAERIPDWVFLSSGSSSRHTQLPSDVADLLELYPWKYTTMPDDAVEAWRH